MRANLTISIYGTFLFFYFAMVWYMTLKFLENVAENLGVIFFFKYQY